MRVNNLRGKHAFIAAATAHGSNSPACVGDQKKRRGDCEPTPNRVGWNGSHRALRSETGDELLAKQRRRSLIELRKIHGRAQRFQVLEYEHTVGAVFQMALEFSGAHGIQFAVKIAVNYGASAVTDHR